VVWIYINTVDVKVILLCTLCIMVGCTSRNGRGSIEDAVEQFRVAMVSADEELLLKLTSPMLSYGHSNGLVEEKGEFVASLLSAKYNFLTIDLKQQAIRLMGDIAIVRHELHA